MSDAVKEYIQQLESELAAVHQRERSAVWKQHLALRWLEQGSGLLPDLRTVVVDGYHFEDVCAALTSNGYSEPTVA